MKFLFDITRKIKRDNNIKKHIREYFPEESLLMNNKHMSQSTHKSILYFTVQRCASRYVMSILKKIKSNSDMTYMDIGGYLWRGGKAHSTPENIYKKTGYIYGPFYGMDKEELNIPIPNIDDFKILLLLRDPRDVLTSYYYHHAYDPYDNPAQQEYIIKRSRDAASKTIDQWVGEKIPIFKARYQEYLDTFIGRPNVLFLKYEDMVGDINNWLNNLISFSGLNVPRDIADLIIQSANFTVDKENVKSHKRQVTPGDHQRKLTDKTIALLNSEFSEILDALKYR